MRENQFRLTNLTRCACSRWQGGSTYELAVGGGSYAARDFLFRVSSAVVELPESEFTPLPDYNRIILPLTAPLTLIHDGGARVRLDPYQAHRFDGGAHTVSLGQAQDFNLMLRKGRCDGSVEVVSLPASEAHAEMKASDCLGLVFCAAGEAQLGAEGMAFALKAGDCLIAEDLTQDCALRASGQGKLICVRVWML